MNDGADRAGPAGDQPQPRYNAIYEQLVRDEGDLAGMIAYALYKQSKRAWIVRFERDEGRRPTEEEVFRSYVRAQGPHELDRLRNQADATLAAYSGVVVEAERPGIVARALESAMVEEARRLQRSVDRNTLWYKGIGANIAGAFLYTLLLIGAVLVLRWAGVDLLGLLEKARP